jgi:hypothetical protein
MLRAWAARPKARIVLRRGISRFASGVSGNWKVMAGLEALVRDEVVARGPIGDG